MILKQDKGRGVVILDATIYTDKLWHFKHETFQKSYNIPYCSHREKLTKIFEKIEI